MIFEAFNPDTNSAAEILILSTGYDFVTKSYDVETMLILFESLKSPNFLFTVLTSNDTCNVFVTSY